MQNCPYCKRAKALLESRGVAFTETLVDDDDDATWKALELRSGMKTMPQIFHGDKLIGGYNQLAALDGKDKLASLK
ncbi:MAG: glutaredoxin 3 [Oligoflexia bacterium]|nr:glutaredoxin 3 [Oligoflexia bacterium]